MEKSEKPKIVILSVSGNFLEKNRYLPKKEQKSFVGIFNSFHSIHLAIIYYEKKDGNPCRIEVCLQNFNTSFCDILREIFSYVKIDEKGDDAMDFILNGMNEDEFSKKLKAKFEVEWITFSEEGHIITTMSEEEYHRLSVSIQKDMNPFFPHSVGGIRS